MDKERKHLRQKAWQQSPEGKAYLSAYAKEYAKRNPEKVKLWRRITRTRHRETYNAWRRKNNHELVEKAKNRNLKEKYGLSLEQFNAMSLSQGGCCAICGDVAKLCVDHDHKTGKLRSLLCRHCNTMIGLAREDRAILERAITYITKHL